ncbi:MAG TPA: outer membrane beta-barrel protein [Anaeromyxobacteraceae bacterium]|nr:outer membrane beta-barrel protein [Anaeromyxobacteraceae bacterium]
MDAAPENDQLRSRSLAPLRWLALAAALAVAQPARAAGDLGFKIGEAGRLHLRLEIDGQYDSNVFYSQAGAPVGGYLVDIIPGFELQVTGNENSLSLKGNLDVKQYLSEEAKDLSKVFGDASLAATLNRNGAVGVELTDTFAHSDQTPSLSVAQAVISNHNDLRLAVPIRPGGGALDLTLSGQWVRETFEEYVTSTGCDPVANPTCVPANIPGYGYNQYGGAAEARWRFLPKTALTLNLDYFQRTPDDETLSLPVNGLRIYGGLAGLVTPRVAVTLKAGWGTAFDSPGFDWSTWLGLAEVQYVTQGPVGAKLGYLHDFRADPGTDYSLYELNRVYADGKILLGGRLTIRATLSWDGVEYVINGVKSSIFTFAPAVDYELMRWIYVGATYTITSRTSSGLAAPVPAFDYTRQLIGLRVVFAY